MSAFFFAENNNRKLLFTMVPFTVTVYYTTGENMFLHSDLIRSSLDSLNTIFPVTGYCYTSVPTYPNGQIGFFIGSKNKVFLLKRLLHV